jgi:protein-disulfide isomerase
MNLKKVSKKSWFFITLFVIVFSIALVGIARATQKDDISSLPTLMEAKGKVEITVGDFKLENNPFLGDPNAPIKVIEFYDFKCPACATWDENYFSDFKEEFIDTGKVQFYAINFPFLGPDSIEAALVAESVYKQNPLKYWEIKDLIFKHQGKENTIWATERFLVNLIENNIEGIDMKQLKKDLKAKTYLFNVKEDFKISTANGVYGTPMFIVNGVKVYADNDQLREVIIQNIGSN